MAEARTLVAPDCGGLCFYFYLLANYLTRRLEQVGFYKQYFETAVKTLQEHGSCVLCRRNFESALERKSFQELVNHKRTGHNIYRVKLIEMASRLPHACNQ